jgi:DNA-binding NtrC family response regulator
MDGAQLRLDATSLEGVTLEPGARATVVIATQELTLESDVLVEWTAADEPDPAGRGVRVRPLGVSWQSPGAAFKQRVHDYLTEFRHTLLVIDADDAAFSAVQGALADHRVVRAKTAAEAATVCDETAIAIAIVGRQAAEDPAVAKLLAAQPGVAVISFGARAEAGFFAIGRLYDYLSKPLRTEAIEQLVSEMLEVRALQIENERLRTEVSRANARLTRENAFLRRRAESLESFAGVVGQSEELRRALSELERIRKTDATVHVRGETGTGKERVARAMHYGGPRKAGPFVAQNCAGLAESLMQSTLFGHEKGAFTGADRARPGVFREADKGTVFLDEVAELSPATQAALLRAIQEREIVPVGGAKPVKVDVRIISATHKDLREEVKAGRFREDLFFRLVVLAVRLPALRERRGDVPLLAQHFLDAMCERHGKNVRGIDRRAMETLERYSWPGNVRELENEIERAVVLSDDGETIGDALLSEHLRQGTRPSGSSGGGGEDGIFVPASLGFDDALELVQKTLIERALKVSGGVVTRAAQVLGINQSRLAKMVKRLG